MNGACVPKQVDVASGCLGLGQSGRDEVSKPSPQGPVSGMQGRITSLDPCEQGLCLHLLASANARAGLGRQTLPFGTVARRRAWGVQSEKHSGHICYTYPLCANNSAPAHSIQRNAHKYSEDVPSSDICRLRAEVIQKSATIGEQPGKVAE